MADEDFGKIIDAAFRYQLAFLSNSATADETFVKNQVKAKELFEEVSRVVRPWTGRPGRAAQDMIDNMVAMYKQVHGIDDVDDPEFLEQIEQYWARRDARVAAVPETDDQRIDRLQAERMKQRHQRRQQGR
jgi:hypothetical protein